MIDKSKSKKYSNEINLLLREGMDADQHISINDIYAYIEKDIDLIYELYKPYLRHVSECPKGQINLESNFGQDIKRLLSQENLSLLEFGCWNGLGSTKLSSSSTSNQVFSVELNPFMVATAVKNLQPFPSNLTLIYGKILDTDSLKINLASSFFSLEFENESVALGALIEIILLKSAPNVLRMLPKEVDCLLLDGGGFMTFEEFLLLESRITKYIFLDDIGSIKSRRIYEVLGDSVDWKVEAIYSDRESAIFKKR